MAEKIVTARKQGWIEKMRKELREAGLDKYTVDDILQDNPTVKDVTHRLKKEGLDRKDIQDLLTNVGVKTKTKLKAKDKISEPHPEAEKHLKKFSDAKEKAMIALITLLCFVLGYILGGMML